ncbi:MAG: gliding motility-associated C-terminal domain-containing protein, partial [Ginsengibacter sp.]
KDFPLPYADATALEARWRGPNGFSSEDLRAVVPSIRYADTGLYLLSQLYYYGCTSSDTFFVKVYPSTTVTTQTEYGICEGKSINFSASGTGTFKWTPSNGLSNDAIPNPVATPKDSILYSLMVTNAYGCKDSAYVKVNVYRNPLTDAGPDRTIVAGDTVLLTGSVSGIDINYSWTPTNFIDNPNKRTPKVFPPESIEYTLAATSNVGCGSSLSSVKINVYTSIFIPNGFSPNGDGINDDFKIFAIDGYKLNKFLIYNRWGRVVFSAKNPSDAWDGNAKNEMQPEGTYLYLLEIENSQGRKIIKKGPLTLVR